MSEKPEAAGKSSGRYDELEELATIAANMKLPDNLRKNAINQLGAIGSYEALLTLLQLAANEGMVTKERDLALKKAREVLKKSAPA